MKTLFPHSKYFYRNVNPIESFPSPKIRVDIFVNIDHGGSVQLTVLTNSNTETRITLMLKCLEKVFVLVLIIR